MAIEPSLCENLFRKFKGSITLSGVMTICELLFALIDFKFILFDGRHEFYNCFCGVYSVIVYLL